MKRLLMLVPVLLMLSTASTLADTTSHDTVIIYGSGGATWYNGTWVYCPLPSDSICAIIIEDDYGNRTTAVYGWPAQGRRSGRRFTYCPLPGNEVCAIVLEGPNPGDPSVHSFFGKGGARRHPNGDWTYCPIPFNAICALVFVGPGDTVRTVVYGAGGIRIYNDGTTDYCPLDGNQICADITELPGPPPPPPPPPPPGGGDTVARAHRLPLDPASREPDVLDQRRERIMEQAREIQQRQLQPGRKLDIE